jgi:hypothetical protein
MPDWMVAFAILFFLWALSAVAQPQRELKISDLRSQIELRAEPQMTPVSPKGKDTVGTVREPPLLSRKRQQSIDRTLSAYGRRLMEERK